MKRRRNCDQFIHHNSFSFSLQSTSCKTWDSYCLSELAASLVFPLVDRSRINLCILWYQSSRLLAFSRWSPRTTRATLQDRRPLQDLRDFRWFCEKFLLSLSFLRDIMFPSTLFVQLYYHNYKGRTIAWIKSSQKLGTVPLVFCVSRPWSRAPRLGQSRDSTSRTGRKAQISRNRKSRKRKSPRALRYYGSFKHDEFLRKSCNGPNGDWEYVVETRYRILNLLYTYIYIAPYPLPRHDVLPREMCTFNVFSLSR